MGVADRFHFRYADGERYLPIGTTAYAWTHQPLGLQQATLGALATSPFTKLRMCVFPKSYLFNSNEPIAYPFAGSIDTGWDFESFNPAFFQRLEDQVAEEPELFTTYVELTAEAQEIVKAHVDTLVGQLARIIADGIARGELDTADPSAAARAVFDATTCYHNPAHAAAWFDPDMDASYENVRALVLAGLTPAVLLGSHRLGTMSA